MGANHVVKITASLAHCRLHMTAGKNLPDLSHILVLYFPLFRSNSCHTDGWRTSTTQHVATVADV